MEQAFYIFLGSFITMGFTYFLEILKQKREDHIHLRDKREEVYLEMLELLTTLHSHQDEFKRVIPNNYRNRLNKMKDLSSVYASKCITDKFYLVIDSYLKAMEQNKPFSTNMRNRLEKMIRKELGIKD